MTTQVTLTLSEDTYHRVEHLARLLGDDFGEFMSETVDNSLQPLTALVESFTPVESLSDEEVMAVADLQVSPEQSARFGILLDRQQAGILTNTERPELWTLMRVYQLAQLRKSEGLREAVQRGLRGPLVSRVFLRKCDNGFAAKRTISADTAKVGKEYSADQFETDHLHPRALGGSDDEENLWLACRSCNGFKGVQTHAVDPLTGDMVSLYNPRHDVWTIHFTWSENSIEIIGLTPTGRATVEALKLNNALAKIARWNWAAGGWHPAKGATPPSR